MSSAKSLFNPEIKNNILCLVEQLLDVFTDYILLSLILLLKSFTFLGYLLVDVAKVIGKHTVGLVPIIGAPLAELWSSGTYVELGKQLYSFLFTFLLGLGLIVSFLIYLFQTFFYMVDPILKMGLVFLMLPFTFLNWVVPVGIGKTGFSDHFKTLINGFLVMIFTALIVSLCGAILLGLLSSVDSFSNLKEALATHSFSSMWSAIEIQETTLLRLIVGIIIVHTMMKRIPDYASKYMQATVEDKTWKEMKTAINETYLKGKKKVTDLLNNVDFLKKMRK